MAINRVDTEKYKLSNAPVIKVTKEKKKKKKEKKERNKGRKKERKRKKAVLEQVYRVVSEKMRNGESWGTEQRIQ